MFEPKFGLDQFVPAKELARDNPRVIDAMNRDKLPRVITRRGSAVAVMLPWGEYLALWRVRDIYEQS